MADDAGAPWPPIDGPLDDVNAAFHSAYAQQQRGAQEQAPVWVLIDHALVTFHAGQRDEVPVSPRLFHVLKSVAHAPIALYIALGEPARRATHAPAHLRTLRATIAAALGSVPTDVPDPQMAACAREVLDASLRLIDETLGGGPGPTHAAMNAFAGAMGPAVLRLTDHATGVQLEALHGAVGKALGMLSAAERRSLQVVVVGDHQARRRSLAMQYFRKRLREAEGVEERVTYGEGITTAEEAMELVGARRLDRHIAGAFFGDPRRLQRDVLGDSARTRLEAVELEAIDDAGPG